MASATSTPIAPDDLERPDELTLLAREFVRRDYPRYLPGAKAEPHR